MLHTFLVSLSLLFHMIVEEFVHAVLLESTHYSSYLSIGASGERNLDTPGRAAFLRLRGYELLDMHCVLGPFVFT